uniref:Transmembrane protein n=1 Tax=Globisporangium ultimum (strain ATCC 200006 / CBS 805.95 / DAOM BR144) TaxID=431595 RepID=K3X0J6_GLOUD
MQKESPDIQPQNPLKAYHSLSLTQSVPGEELADSRFVAGENFYNHEMYGTLRRGGALSFYSVDCLGLAAATFSSLFSYQCLTGVLRPHMSIEFALSVQQNVSVQRLIEIPMALSFLVGLLSDCYPIMGLRRKGYMILGLVLNGASVFVVAGISAHFESHEPKNGDRPSDAMVVLGIVMAALASLGCIITYLCVHTRVIELSQREPLRTRGSIQATYLIFRRLVSLLAASFTYAVMGKGTRAPNVSLSTAMILLAVISILPLPVILKFWKEEHYSLHTSMKIRGRIFWKIMQQKAVWRIMAFICFFTLFLSIKFSDSTNVIRKWSGAATDNSLVVKVITDVVILFTIAVWRYAFMNRSWRLFFASAPLFQIIPHLLIAILVAFDVVRNRYLYRTMFSATAIADGINSLNNMVPLTEIIQEGSEGATVGLTLSLQRLIGIFVSTNAVGLFQGNNFYDPAEVAADSSSAHWDVLLSLVLNFGLNALALIGLFFLPSQKLDAQQLRMYGGFTKAASSLIIAFSVVMFVYSLVINIMTFVPSLSCVKLVGGAGCSS